MEITKCSKFIMIETENFKFILIPSYNSNLNKYLIRASVMSFSTKTDYHERMKGNHTHSLFEYSFEPKSLLGEKRKHEYLIHAHEKEFYEKSLSYLNEYKNKMEVLEVAIGNKINSLEDDEAEGFFNSL